MEDHAATLGLTYKQLRGWFIEKRRRDKRDNGTILTPQTKIAKRKIKPILLLQNFFTPDYILKKVFRKDGPPLGVQFDSLPSPSIFSPKGILHILQMPLVYSSFSYSTNSIKIGR